MACSCGGRRATPAPKVIGYDYTPPGGGVPERFNSQLLAEKAKRRNGGGEIVPVYR